MAAANTLVARAWVLMLKWASGPGPFVLAFILSSTTVLRAQQATPPTPPALLDTTIAAGESDALQPVKRGLNKYNEWDFGFTTFRIGYGFLIDFATYAQDSVSKEQVTIETPDIGLRDFRLLFKGKFNTKRPLSWTMGVMYDGGTEDWHFRQTGLMFAVPEIRSNFFIGRTKEGYSQYKYMVGYDIWTIERSPFLDAFIPILGDGIKWIFDMPKRHLMLQLAWFGDALSENEKFALYDNQFVGRLVYLPVVTPKGPLVHLAVMGRIVEPDEGQFRAKSKPEAYLTPNFIDTGTYPSEHAKTLGFEAFFRRGPWLVGGEYGWQWMDAPTVGNPMYHGGNIAVSWLVTGETRGYNVVSGYFKAVSPTRTIFEGGPGTVELGLNLSFLDTNDGSQPGGKFWRITPLMKWHLMDYLRIELGYGYGVLDRNGVTGKTHFFQGRFLTAL